MLVGGYLDLLNRDGKVHYGWYLSLSWDPGVYKKEKVSYRSWCMIHICVTLNVAGIDISGIFGCPWNRQWFLRHGVKSKGSERKNITHLLTNYRDMCLPGHRPESGGKQPTSWRKYLQIMYLTKGFYPELVKMHRAQK